jgi:hypothetical protein
MDDVIAEQKHLIKSKHHGESLRQLDTDNMYSILAGFGSRWLPEIHRISPMDRFGEHRSYGHRFTEPWPHQEITIDSIVDLPDLWNVGPGFFACSTAVKDILERSGERHFESFPMTIHFREESKAISGSHWFIHFFDPIDCVDMSRSKFYKVLPDSDLPPLTETLWIEPTKIPAERRIFRLEPTFLSKLLVVHRDLVLQLRPLTMPGFCFLENGRYSSQVIRWAPED